MIMHASKQDIQHPITNFLGQLLKNYMPKKRKLATNTKQQQQKVCFASCVVFWMMSGYRGVCKEWPKLFASVTGLMAKLFLGEYSGMMLNESK